ncbi:MAG TPA: hypothetical protein VGS00_11185 [Thermoanaerobaculia bacterium]|nr:hypothetical protein [Thermoanaerobaculia bacterium]
MSGLEKEFNGRVKGQNVDATTPESKKVIKDLGFQTHGLVIRSPEGKVLWKQKDHDVQMDDVRSALKEMLK